jgi:hypothetical protein
MTLRSLEAALEARPERVWRYERAELSRAPPARRRRISGGGPTASRSEAERPSHCKFSPQWTAHDGVLAGRLALLQAAGTAAPSLLETLRLCGGRGPTRSPRGSATTNDGLTPVQLAGQASHPDEGVVAPCAFGGRVRSVIGRAKATSRSTTPAGILAKPGAPMPRQRNCLSRLGRRPSSKRATPGSSRCAGRRRPTRRRWSSSSRIIRRSRFEFATPPGRHRCTWRWLDQDYLPPKVVELLLDRWTGALRVRDANGSLPLELAGRGRRDLRRPVLATLQRAANPPHFGSADGGRTWSVPIGLVRDSTSTAIHRYGAPASR